MIKRWKSVIRRAGVFVVGFVCQQASAQESLEALEKLAEADPAPFVIVEGRGKKTKSRAQGVVIFRALERAMFDKATGSKSAAAWK